ncbi:MAG: TlpA disulfide reductase family protein [Candidatus Kapaibacterium sp.]
MRKNTHPASLILCVTAFLMCPVHISASTTDPRAILKRIQDKLKSARSISYDVHYRLKFFSKEDTNTYDAHVDILREPSDSAAGCYLWVRHTNGFTKFYDTKTLYIIRQKDTSVNMTDIHKYPRPVTRGWYGDAVLDDMFLQAVSGKSYFDSTVEMKYTGDSTDRSGRLYSNLTYRFRSTEEMEFEPNYWLVDNNLDYPVFRHALAKFQGNYQFDEVQYSNVVFDKLDTNYFKKFAVPSEYKVTEFVPRKEKQLAIGETAPEFNGLHFPDTTSTIHLSDYRGKIVILDFWYMGCYWCIKAFPALEEISKKYGGKDVIVLGINSEDRFAPQQKIVRFLEHNPITYSVILADRKVDNSYHVGGYPTLFIIDKSGKIAKVREGYDPDLTKILSAELDAMLK